MRFIIFAKLSNSLTTGYMFLLCGVEVWTNECICKISVMLGSTIIAALQYNSCSPIYERYAFIFVILPIPICCITTIHINRKLSEQTISAKFLFIILGSFM